MTNDGESLLTVVDIMERLNISRALATRLLMDERCPILDRKKGGKIYVTEEGWRKYMEKLSNPA